MIRLGISENGYLRLAKYLLRAQTILEDDPYDTDVIELTDEDIMELTPEELASIGLAPEAPGAEGEPEPTLNGIIYPEFYIPVESSNVQEFGYVPDEKTLFVRFLGKGGGLPALYRYFEVEPDIYNQFFAAPSKGKFIWTHLRDRYDYERLE
jgi:hypothetical protein